jgi:hypothetical protein
MKPGWGPELPSPFGRGAGGEGCDGARGEGLPPSELLSALLLDPSSFLLIV